MLQISWEMKCNEILCINKQYSICLFQNLNPLDIPYHIFSKVAKKIPNLCYTYGITFFYDQLLPLG